MDFSINVYGPSKSEIEPLSDVHNLDCQQLFKKAFLWRCMSKEHSWTPFGAPSSDYGMISYSFIHGTDGYGYCAIKNDDPLKDIKADVFIEGTNVSISKHST